jgi:hypothetical protein
VDNNSPRSAPATAVAAVTSLRLQTTRINRWVFGGVTVGMNQSSTATTLASNESNATSFGVENVWKLARNMTLAGSCVFMDVIL